MVGLTKNFIFVLLFLYASYGQGTVMPEVIGHTPLSVAAIKGDKVTFAIAVSGEIDSSVTIKWSRFETVLCSDLTCVVETHNLGLGDHKIVATISTGWGSRSVEFRLSVLTGPPGYRPLELTPKIEERRRPTIDLDSEDYFVEAVLGRGFLGFGKRKRAISGAPISARGVDSIECQNQCGIRFGQLGVEEHAIVANTQIATSVLDSRRVLELKRGALRSRQLVKQDPNWTISVADRIQIDGDNMSDLLIGYRPDKKSVLITVLRGEARVIRSKLSSKKEWERQTFTIPQGVFVKLKLNDLSPVEWQHPPRQQVQNLFALTSPQYMDNAQVPWLGALVVGASKSLLDLLEERDYIGIVQQLTSAEYELSDQNKIFILAKAYAGLFQYDRAKILLENILVYKQNVAGMYELLGTIALLEERWEDAVNAFQIALEDKNVDSKRLNYYLGVAELKRGYVFAANHYLQSSLWEPSQAETDRPAKNLVHEIRKNSFLNLSMGLGLFHDTNVTRRSEKVASGQDAMPGHGARLKIDGDMKFVNDEMIEFHLKWKNRGRFWEDTVLQNVNATSSQISLPFTIRFPTKKSEKDLFNFSLIPLVQVEQFGKSKPTETVGADIVVGSPVWFEARTFLRTRVVNDTKPNSLDAFDTLHYEPVYTADRSYKWLGLGIGLALIDTQSWRMDAELLRRDVYFRAASAQDDSQEVWDLDFKLDYLAEGRWGGLAYFKNQRRNFTSTSEERVDLLNDVGLGVTWRMSPAIDLTLDVSYRDMQSDLIDASYESQTLGINLDLRI
jgi:tetratricopeptide (TPR) repeat protein